MGDEVVFEPFTGQINRDCLVHIWGDKPSDLPNEARLQAVFGNATIRCCEDDQCKERAARLARELAHGKH